MEKRVIIQPYDWNSFDCPERERNVIRCWGLDSNSNPHLITIPDFKPFMYIELPLYGGGRLLNWNESLARSIDTYLKHRLKDDAPVICSFRTMRKLYYYRANRTFPMLIVYFETVRAMNHCINALKEPIEIPSISPLPMKLHCWETNIPVVRKLLTLKKMGYSQWLEIPVTVPEEPESTLTNEWICSWTDLTPLSPEQTKGWVTHPKIAVIDIESYSSNHDAFPDKYKAADVAYMVSVICQRYQQPNTRTNHLIMLSPSEQSNVPSFDDVEVINVRTEVELCQALATLINRLDPEIVTGYNIFSFDYDYLDTRLKKRAEDWEPMGRIKGNKTWMKTKTWESSAYGVQNLNILMMDGRISVDMYPIIQRDYKLSKYDLNTVCHHFLGKGKHDVKAKEMFQIYQRYVSSHDPTEMIKVARYCIQDSVLVIELMEKVNIWISLTEMSNVVGVPIMDIFTRGQQIRFLCQLYDMATNEGIVLDQRPSLKESFSGAFVYEPIPGLYDYVICLDFSSLYPSIIRAFNICFTTLVPEESSIPDDLCHVLEWEDEGKKYRYRFVKEPQGLLPKMCDNLVTERSRVRKTILAPLQDSGGHPKDDLTPEQKLIHLVADKRQLALKVCANSIFGALGAGNGYLPLIEGARSICAIGKRLILQANQYLADKYQAKIIYNDTDSTMVKLPFVSSNQEAIEWGYRLQEEISSLYPPPLKMEFEKAGRMLSICKKKYSYWLIDRETFQFKLDRKGEPALMNKGIVLARRDNCEWQRSIYKRVLMRIMTHADLYEVLDMVNEEILALARGEVPWSKLSIIRTLGSDYKADNYFMAVFSRELDKIGKPMQPGSRLEYVVVQSEEKTVGMKMRLVDTYLERRGTPQAESLDIFYYIEKALANCVQQLISVGYKDQLEELENYYQQMGWYRLFNTLAEMKDRKGNNYEPLVREASQKHQSYQEIYQELLNTPGLKTKVKELHSRFLGKRRDRTARIGKTPVQNQLKILLMKKAVIDELKKMSDV